MNLLLIPVADSLPAIREHFGRYPNDEAVSAEELRELCVLAVHHAREERRLTASNGKEPGDQKNSRLHKLSCRQERFARP